MIWYNLEIKNGKLPEHFDSVLAVWEDEDRDDVCLYVYESFLSDNGVWQIASPNQMLSLPGNYRVTAWTYMDQRMHDFMPIDFSDVPIFNGRVHT